MRLNSFEKNEKRQFLEKKYKEYRQQWEKINIIDINSELNSEKYLTCDQLSYLQGELKPANMKKQLSLNLLNKYGMLLPVCHATLIDFRDRSLK